MSGATRETASPGWAIPLLGASSAVVWAAMLVPALVHRGALLDHRYRFLTSWVLGLPSASPASARVDGLVFAGLTATLLGLWLAALCVAARRGTDARTRWLVLCFAIGFALLGVAQVPFTSWDPFYYRAVGLVVARGGNPYVDPVALEVLFLDPPFHAVYHPPLWGPSMLWLFGAATALAGSDVLADLLALKLSVLLFHLANLWLVQRIAREVAPGRESLALVLYGWSPLLVLEHAGIGHNDPPMLTGLLLSVWLVHRRRFAAACVAVAAAVAFKAPALLAALPLALVCWLALGRRALPTLLAGGALSLLLLALLYAPFWAGLDTFSGLAEFRSSHWGSLPLALRLLVWRYAGGAADPRSALDLLSSSGGSVVGPYVPALDLICLLLFAAGCALLARHLLRRGHGVGAVDYAEAVVTVMLLYLVTEQRYYWSWYASWALALAPFGSPRSAAVRAAVVLSVGSLLGSAVFRFAPATEWFTPPVQWAAILVSFGPLLAYALLLAVRGLSRARRRSSG